MLLTGGTITTPMPQGAQVGNLETGRAMPKTNPDRSGQILVSRMGHDLHLLPVSGWRNSPVAKFHQKPEDVQIMQGGQAEIWWGRGEVESRGVKRSYSLTYHEGTALARN